MNNNEKKQLLELIEESHNISNLAEVTIKIKNFVDIHSITINDLEELKNDKLIFSHISGSNEQVFDVFTHIWFSDLSALGKIFINYQNDCGKKQKLI